MAVWFFFAILPLTLFEEKKKKHPGFQALRQLRFIPEVGFDS